MSYPHGKGQVWGLSRRLKSTASLCFGVDSKNSSVQSSLTAWHTMWLFIKCLWSHVINIHYLQHDLLYRWQIITVVINPTRANWKLTFCAMSQYGLISTKSNKTTFSINTSSVLLFSRPQSEGWPHHRRTFSIYLCPLSFWLTLPRAVLSTYWCCPCRPCMVFLTCVHLTLFLAC